MAPNMAATILKLWRLAYGAKHGGHDYIWNVTISIEHGAAGNYKNAQVVVQLLPVFERQYLRVWNMDWLIWLNGLLTVSVTDWQVDTY